MDFIQTRESLLSRLKDWRDDRSWQDFYETYWRLIYNVGVQAGLSDAEARDVLQETVVEVAGKIKEFRYDPEKGRFKGWLLQITRWRITDQLRRRERNARRNERLDSPRTTLAERITDPSAEQQFADIWNQEWKENVLQTAQQRVRERVAARTFQSFELTVLKGWTVARTAQVLGISQANVYLAKHRVATALKEEIKKFNEEMEPTDLQHTR